MEEEMELLNEEAVILHLFLPHKVKMVVLEVQVDLQVEVELQQLVLMVDLLVEALVLVEQELLLILQVLQ